MNEFRITPQALVNTVIASGLVLLFSSAPFGLLTTIGGITLLLILFSYDQGSQRSVFQSLAFAAVSAFPFTLAAGMLLQQLAGPQNLRMALAFTWLVVTVLVTAIDRARMGSRASAQPAPYPTATVAAPTPVAHSAHPPRYGLGLGGPTTVTEPQPAIRTEPAHPAYTAPAPQPPPPQPIYQPPIPHQPPPAAVPEETLPSFAAVPPPTAQPDTSSPASAVPVVNPAAVTTIHVNIIGQGISLLRPVQAEHLARDVYRIIEPVPEGERWKYETGQAVRCRKQKLSSGKALVAYEEVILQRVG